jgi:hypothetical protein
MIPRPKPAAKQGECHLARALDLLGTRSVRRASGLLEKAIPDFIPAGTAFATVVSANATFTPIIRNCVASAIPSLLTCPPNESNPPELLRSCELLNDIE